MNPQPPGAHAKPTIQDLEIKDAQVIFDAAWSDLEKKHGRENMSFPREIFWLNGAPGAGKGTNTRFIMKYRDYSSSPIVVSDLLQSPEARKRIDAGMLVGDLEVIEILLDKLLTPEFKDGAVVDGFPRTVVQVEFLKLFYKKLNALRAEFRHSSFSRRFPKLQFHILVLFVDENESVRRQLKRGEEAVIHNAKIAAGVSGIVMEVRKTDLDPDTARGRYRLFKERTYDPLQSLKEIFHYHLINAQGSFAAVEQRIIDELKYQSSLELSEATHDSIAPISLAAEIVKHARQALVRRLDEYAEQSPEIFKKVIALIQSTFMPVVIRHAITGEAHINSESEIFDNPLAISMFIDVFSERGYHASVDVHNLEIPASFNPATFEIVTRVKKVYRTAIRFSGSEIRRG